MQVRRTILLTSLSVLVMVSGCADTPTEVYEEIEQAASEGDASGFAAHFTKESRPFAEALMSLYLTQSAARGPTTGPLEVLAFSEVREENVRGKRADLVVESPNGTRSTLVFELEDGEWKLDIVETEKKNAGADFGD